MPASAWQYWPISPNKESDLLNIFTTDLSKNFWIVHIVYRGHGIIGRLELYKSETSMSTWSNMRSHMELGEHTVRVYRQIDGHDVSKRNERSSKKIFRRHLIQTSWYRVKKERRKRSITYVDCPLRVNRHLCVVWKKWSDLMWCRRNFRENSTIQNDTRQAKTIHNCFA